MSTVKTRSRPRLPEEARRNCPLKVWITFQEQVAVDLIVTDGPYESRSDFMRAAIALLINTNHNKYSSYLHSTP